MATVSPKKKASKKRVRMPAVKIDKNMKSHADDPFVVKKAQEAKAFLEKHPFPKELLVKK